MRRKLILLVLTLVTVVGGMAAMSAFTAQMVNIQAHAEKDIALEPIICSADSLNGGDYTKPCFVDPTGGNYGVTLPQVLYDKEIELTLSNSFFDQGRFFDIVFAGLWECKQFSDLRDRVNNVTGELGPDGIPDCREDGLDDSICAVDLDRPPDGRADILRHCDPEKLDGSIRGYIAISTKGVGNAARCQREEGDSGYVALEPKASWPAKNIVQIFSGTINKSTPKCRWELKLDSPPCVGSINPYTDPNPLGSTPVVCHKGDKARHIGFDDDADTVVDEDPLDGRDNDLDGRVDEDPGAEVPPLVNPQDIDEFADLGDEFKIQVAGHSLTP